MESSRDRYPVFRYSLREAFVATVAVAAVTALFVKNRPYSPSSFLETFDEVAVLKQVATDVGVTLDVGGSGRGDGPVFGGGHQRTADLHLRLPAIAEFESKIMPALHRRIEKMLDESGCRIHGRSKGGSTDFEQVSEFSFRYRQGVADGMLRVYSIPYPNDQVRLLVLLDEH